MKHNKSISNINWEIEQILPENVNWALPQILADIGSNWPIKKNASGLYSFTDTLALWAQLMDNKQLLLGNNFISKNGCRQLLSWLNQAPRGQVLGSTARQTSKEWIRYSAPVPLILSAFKQYRNVKYSHWDWTDSKRNWFFDDDFGALTNLGADLANKWTKEELLEFRQCALEVKSGLKQGTIRRPESTATVYGVTDSEFKKLPRLAKLALLQLWVFSPTLRTELMVTNPFSLDSYPEPLIETEIFTTPTEDSPW